MEYFCLLSYNNYFFECYSRSAVTLLIHDIARSITYINHLHHPGKINCYSSRMTNKKIHLKYFAEFHSRQKFLNAVMFNYINGDKKKADNRNSKKHRKYDKDMKIKTK